MALIETGIPLSAPIDYRDARLPIVPRGGDILLLSDIGFREYALRNTKTRAIGATTTIPTPYPYNISIPVAANTPCNPFRVSANIGIKVSTADFQVVLPSENIAYIDTYMTGGADYNVGGTDYPHRIYFYMASLQIDTAEKVTKYDDERGTIIPLSATNYKTYTLQTMNTDAFTLAKLMKICNNDHIKLNYIDADGNSQSVDLVRGIEAPTIERYPKMSSGSFSCKFVKI